MTLSSRALRSQDFGSLANQLRTVVRYFRPDLTTPPPAEPPNLVSQPDRILSESDVVTVPLTQAVIP